MEDSNKFKKLEEDLKNNKFDPSKQFEEMKEAFDENGKLIEGKELDPEGKMSAETKMEIAQKMISHQAQVKKEEESLLKKINDNAIANENLPRKAKREKLRVAVEDYKKHMRLKPKIDINDDDQTSFNKTIEINHWRVRKNSIENIIVRYSSEKKLNQIKKDVNKLL